jgi:hypothetical protein
MLKKLPIGIQTFKKMREGNYVYIDKTEEALSLIENYEYIFLSRPRRFGKSLFLDTLRNIFEGNKELFEGLYIYDKWDWDTKYPVIKISFSGDLRTPASLGEHLVSVLKENQTDLEVVCENRNNASICFRELIRNTYKKYNRKVVVLIDEYDKAILDNLDHLDVAVENREIIKGFYTILKDSDEYIRFAFLTGVSRFSKASIFSGLNMFTDISLNPVYGNICGYTQYDIETSFKPYLENVDKKRFRLWYNGYNFLKDDVYNPFDVLQFIANNKIFDNYWFSSGTPSFLVKLIKKKRYFLPKLSDLTVGKELMDSFDIENINVEVILYQSGYLTIEKMIAGEDDDLMEYRLKLPNKEVKISFNKYIIEHLFDQTTPNPAIKAIRRALKEADLTSFKETFVSIFASIPYNNLTYVKNYEGFYASIVYIYLQSLGIEIIGEDVTNCGRIDLTVFVEDKIYIMEFKVDPQTAGEALEQIKEKKYYEKYLNSDTSNSTPEIYLVGIEFDSIKKI